MSRPLFVVNMDIYNSSILALWLIFLVYWAISAFSMKRSVGARAGRRSEAGLRLGIMVVVVLATRISMVNRALRNGQAYMPSSTLMRIIGVLLCALGVGLAIWARVTIGRNWGMPMSQKENPELVTSGPYAFIRHPIYTGVLTAMLGSVIGHDVIWLLPLILFGAYFAYSARREEKLMIEEFPEQYPAYMSRTRMLLPFVL